MCIARPSRTCPSLRLRERGAENLSPGSDLLGEGRDRVERNPRHVRVALNPVVDRCRAVANRGDERANARSPRVQPSRAPTGAVTALLR